MGDLSEWSSVELLDEYRSVVEFRVIESSRGQISPGEISLLRALESEMLERMEDAQDTEE